MYSKARFSNNRLCIANLSPYSLLSFPKIEHVPPIRTKKMKKDTWGKCWLSTTGELATTVVNNKHGNCDALTGLGLPLSYLSSMLKLVKCNKGQHDSVQQPRLCGSNTSTMHSQSALENRRAFQKCAGSAQHMDKAAPGLGLCFTSFAPGLPIKHGSSPFALHHTAAPDDVAQLALRGVWGAAKRRAWMQLKELYSHQISQQFPLVM